MEIGKNITAFRKDAGMTQEDLANQIGVSAQAVSKWETGVSMPDILLLPVIADVFDITVDEIYTGKREPEKEVPKHFHFDELPEMLYQEVLESESCGWPYETEEQRKGWLAELKENLAKDNRCAHACFGNRGGAVVAVNDFALIHRTFGTKASLDILNSEKAASLLETLLDKNVRKVFLYLLTVGKSRKMFTTAGIARKVELSVEECQKILDKMTEMNLIYYNEADLDGEADLKVYSLFGECSKALYSCMIFELAELIGRNTWYYGHRGVYLPVDKD